MSDNKSNPRGLVYSPLLHRFAIFLTFWAFFVVFIGGTVKSHEAGLSIVEPFIFHWIKDWYNRPNLKWEFFHRMIVGVLYAGTFAFMTLVLLREKRPVVRRFAIVLFIAVNVQAAIGYMTVWLLAHAQTSIPHAALGQSFLAMMAGMTTVLSSKWMGSQTPIVETKEPSLFKLARANVIMVFVQLLLGAALRHDDQSKAMLEGNAWSFYTHLAAHVIGALAVAHFMARLILRVFREHRSQSELLQPARYIMMLLGIQLMLGTGAAIFKVIYVEDSNFPPPIRVWTATAHVAVGALILLFSTLLTVRSVRYAAPALYSTAELAQPNGAAVREVTA